MKKTNKSAIMAWIFFAAWTVPLGADAGTFTFFGKDAFAAMSDSNGAGLSMSLGVFEASTLGASSMNGAGAFVVGTNYLSNQCWFGFGTTDDLKFAASDVRHVTASGSVNMTWFEFCSTFSSAHTSFTETVTFNGNWSAVRDLTARDWGTGHREYGDFKNDSVFDEIVAPATVTGGTIQSPAFGGVNPAAGEVGDAKAHSVQVVAP